MYAKSLEWTRPNCHIQVMYCSIWFVIFCGSHNFDIKIIQWACVLSLFKYELLFCQNPLILSSKIFTMKMIFLSYIWVCIHLLSNMKCHSVKFHLSSLLKEFKWESFIFPISSNLFIFHQSNLFHNLGLLAVVRMSHYLKMCILMLICANFLQWFVWLQTALLT